MSDAPGTAVAVVETGTAVAPPSDAAGRLEEIRSIRRDRPDDYRVNRQKLEKEELDLLEKKGAVTKAGDFGTRAQLAADVILAALPTTARDGLAGDFNCLPTTIQRAFAAELAAGPPIHVVAADATALKRFAAVPGGADMLREWGAQAGRRLATFWARRDRVLMSLDVDDIEEAHDFLEGLPVAEAQTILRAMTR